MKPKVANPPLQKWAEFSAHTIHSLIFLAILQGIMVLELVTSGQGYKTTFTLPSTNVWNKFCFHCKSLQVKRIIKGVYNVSSEFCRFLEGGLATLGFIFSVISSSILKISVPIM